MDDVLFRKEQHLSRIIVAVVEVVESQIKESTVDKSKMAADEKAGIDRVEKAVKGGPKAILAAVVANTDSFLSDFERDASAATTIDNLRTVVASYISNARQQMTLIGQELHQHLV